ncbi:nucleolar protein 56 [Parasteatoda tepidariorum]|uniref:nucleolar protein 56 n=1 Tax=Parasteatoda tepidariorum TaxID=114398 RepID=UPI001C71AA1F|nr:nucleolar protein 56 [Parasteatoda tepidariorum]
MPCLYVLFEHAAGYGLFKSMKFEDIEEFKDVVEPNVAKLEKFKQIVELLDFRAFKNTRHALDNMNSMSEGILHPELKEFLEESVPKKKKSIVGVADPKLAVSISELGFNISADTAVQEIIRGLRRHFHTLVEGFEDASAASKSQLGLGHYYSRARVKFNVNRIDNMIIQSISLLDQLDKDINTFVMRVREWYSLHFPELLQVVPENAMFIQCVHVIKNRKEIEGLEDDLEKVLGDRAKVEKIMILARCSMGMDVGGPDLENVYSFVERIMSMTEKRKEIMEYLKEKMHNVAPNLAALIGEVVGARLIAHSGSLTNLAKAPASTVQILGAEKALFRALKTRGNTPKYGLLYHSKFIGRAAKADKGRISRYLANKCAVASRIDCFRDVPTSIYGEKMKDQVENRLKFFETGEIPAKNIDLMAEAFEEAEAEEKQVLKERKRAIKKAKKQLLQDVDESALMNGLTAAVANHVDTGETESPTKKKKKKRKQMEEESAETNHEASEDFVARVGGKTKAELKAERKAKKRKLMEESIEEPEMDLSLNTSEVNDDITPKKKKKKKQKELGA